MGIASKIIKKCGGAAVVAEMTGVHVSRVHRWTYSKERGGTGGLIPAQHQQTILDEALRRGIPLTPVDFFEPHRSTRSGRTSAVQWGIHAIKNPL